MSLIDRINSEREYSKKLKRASQKIDYSEQMKKWKEDFENCDKSISEDKCLYTFYSWFPYFITSFVDILVPLNRTYFIIYSKHTSEDIDAKINEEAVSNIDPLSITDVMDFFEKTNEERRIKILRKFVNDVFLENKIVTAINMHDKAEFAIVVNQLTNPKLFLQALTMCITLEQFENYNEQNSETISHTNKETESIAELFTEKGYVYGGKMLIEAIRSDFKTLEIIAPSFFTSRERFLNIIFELLRNSDFTDAKQVENTKVILSKNDLCSDFWKILVDKFISIICKGYVKSILCNYKCSEMEIKALESIYDRSSDPNYVRRMVSVVSRRKGLELGRLTTNQEFVLKASEDFIDLSKLYKVADVSLYFSLARSPYKNGYEENFKNFTNGLAKLGYIENDNETKKTFFMRFTGKSENKNLTSAKKIRWKENPKLLYVFVKFYYGKNKGKYEQVMNFFDLEEEYGELMENLSKGISSYMEIPSGYEEYKDLLHNTFPKIWKDITQ